MSLAIAIGIASFGMFLPWLQSEILKLSGVYYVVIISIEMGSEFARINAATETTGKYCFCRRKILRICYCSTDEIGRSFSEQDHTSCQRTKAGLETRRMSFNHPNPRARANLPKSFIICHEICPRRSLS